MTALEEVIQRPQLLRRVTLMLTSSQAGAIPLSTPIWARGTYPPSGSADSATRGCLPGGEQPAMMPATWVPCPNSSVSPGTAPAGGAGPPTGAGPPGLSG